MSGATDFAELHDQLRAVAHDLLGAEAGGTVDWARAVGAGWPGLEVPESCDGSGATFAEVAVVLEEMGRAASTSPFVGTAVLGVAALTATVGDDGRDDELLRDIAVGDARVAVALAHGGDDVFASPPFRIEGTAGAARLAGAAEFVIDAPDADTFVLLATDGDGAPVLVQVAAELLEVTVQPVLDHTRRFGTVRADGVPLADDRVRRLRGDPADAAQRLLDRAVVAVACDSYGLAGAMLDATVAYVGVRRQFDRPIGSFQAVQHACADMAVHLRVAEQLLRAAVDAVATSDPDAAAAVARAKSYVCATAVEVVGSAMQLHGGIGYTWESGLHVYLKRAVLNRALHGSPAAHRRRLAGMIRRVEK